MINFICSSIENIHENIDPSYLKEKEGVKNNVLVIGLVSTATFVTSIAFAIFGIALTVSSGLGAFIGFPIILVSLPVGYLSYNAYKISKNTNDIIDNPKKYQRLFGLDPAFDKQKIKNKLEQGTFCFSSIVEIALEGVAKFGNVL